MPITPPQPGERRNPNGRPKGKPNRSTIAKKWLTTMERVKNPATGEEEWLTQEDIITLAQIKKARKGDTQAYRALMDNMYGKMKEELEIIGEQFTEVKIVAASEYLKAANDDLEDDHQ